MLCTPSLIPYGNLARQDFSCFLRPCTTYFWGRHTAYLTPELTQGSGTWSDCHSVCDFKFTYKQWVMWKTPLPLPPPHTHTHTHTHKLDSVCDSIFTARCSCSEPWVWPGWSHYPHWQVWYIVCKERMVHNFIYPDPPCKIRKIMEGSCCKLTYYFMPLHQTVGGAMKLIKYT